MNGGCGFVQSSSISVSNTKHAQEVIESKQYLEDDNMAAYKTLLEEAEALLTELVTDTEYAEMITALEEAEGKLVEVPVVSLDLKALEYVLETARKIDLSEYLDLPANEVFSNARAEAEDILARAKAGDKSITQKMVNDATTKLHAALLDLRIIPNKDKLKELLSDATTRDLSQYTTESGAVLKLAIDLAQAVYDDPLSDEDDVKAAQDVLAAAIDNLVPIKQGGEEPGDNPQKPDDGNDTPTGDHTPLTAAGALLVLSFAALTLLKQKKK